MAMEATADYVEISHGAVDAHPSTITNRPAASLPRWPKPHSHGSPAASVLTEVSKFVQILCSDPRETPAEVNQDHQPSSAQISSVSASQRSGSKVSASV